MTEPGRLAESSARMGRETVGSGGDRRGLKREAGYQSAPTSGGLSYTVQDSPGLAG